MWWAAAIGVTAHAAPRPLAARVPLVLWRMSVRATTTGREPRRTWCRFSPAAPVRSAGLASDRALPSPAPWVFSGPRLSALGAVGLLGLRTSARREVAQVRGPDARLTRHAACRSPVGSGAAPGADRHRPATTFPGATVPGRAGSLPFAGARTLGRQARGARPAGSEATREVRASSASRRRHSLPLLGCNRAAPTGHQATEPACHQRFGGRKRVSRLRPAAKEPDHEPATPGDSIGPAVQRAKEQAGSATPAREPDHRPDPLSSHHHPGLAGGRAARPQTHVPAAMSPVRRWAGSGRRLVEHPSHTLSTDPQGGLGGLGVAVAREKRGGPSLQRESTGRSARLRNRPRRWFECAFLSISAPCIPSP